MFTRLTVFTRLLLFLLLLIPVSVGLIGIVFPSFGYFPALDRHDFSFDIFKQLFAVDGVGRMVWLSLFTGIGSTLLATLCTFLLLAACYKSSFLSKVQTMLSPLLVLPHAATAIALLFVLSPSGLFARLIGSITSTTIPSANAAFFPYDDWGISVLCALVLKEVPFILLMALSVMAQPSNVRKLAGYQRVGVSLGYNEKSIFFKLMLPSIYAQIRLPILAVLVFATSNVEIPLILAANNPGTLSTAILHWFNHVDLSMRLLGSAASILQVFVCVFAILFFITIERGLALWGRNRLHAGKRNFFERSIAFLGTSVLAVYAVLIAMVVYVVVMYSFATYWPFPRLLPQGFTLLHWQTALSAIDEPFWNAAALALATSTSSVVFVLLTLESEVLAPVKQKMARLFSFSLFLPLLVPGVAFLYGLVWFQQLLSTHTLGFHTYIAHMVYVVPYVYLSLAVSYRRFDPRYAYVAQSLGKSPFQVFWHVKLPMLTSAVCVSWALGMAISFSQYLPTLLASGGAIPTVTTEAVASVSGSSERLTAVYAILQGVMPFMGFVIAWMLPAMIRFFRTRNRNRFSQKVTRHGP